MQQAREAGGEVRGQRLRALHTPTRLRLPSPGLVAPEAQPPHPPRSEIAHLVRLSGGEQVEIFGGAPQQQVAHRAPHHIRLVACRREQQRGQGRQA